MGPVGMPAAPWGGSGSEMGIIGDYDSTSFAITCIGSISRREPGKRTKPLAS